MLSQTASQAAVLYIHRQTKGFHQHFLLGKCYVANAMPGTELGTFYMQTTCPTTEFQCFPLTGGWQTFFVLGPQ